MALKTIYGYKDVDFGFTPIEDADYTETNVVQKYDVINNALDKANTVLSKFLEVCGDINDQLSSIGNTGIESTELDATFQTIGNYLHNAQFQLETSNKEFDKLTTEELEEIAAANRAAQEALDQATGYGQRADTDHSKKACDYIMSVPGFAEIFGQVQSTVEVGNEKVTADAKKNVGNEIINKGDRGNTFSSTKPEPRTIREKIWAETMERNNEIKAENQSIGLANPIKLDDYYETASMGLAEPKVTIKPATSVPFGLNSTPETQAIGLANPIKLDDYYETTAMGLAEPKVTIKPATSVPFGLNPTTETQAIGLANPNVTNKPTYNVIPEFYEKIQSGEYKVDPNIYVQKMDLPTGTATIKPISGVKFDTQAIGLANPSGDATTKRFQQEVLNLNSLQKSLDQDLAAFAKK